MKYSDFLYQAFEVLSPIFLLLISWISFEIRRLISQRIKNERVKDFLLYLDDSVFHAVNEIEQILVKQIREANLDGEITKEEKDKIKQTALESVKNHLGPKGIEAIASDLGVADVDKFLSTRIESAVFSLSEKNSDCCSQKDKTL